MFVQFSLTFPVCSKLVEKCLPIFLSFPVRVGTLSTHTCGADVTTGVRRPRDAVDAGSVVVETRNGCTRNAHVQNYHLQITCEKHLPITNINCDSNLLQYITHILTLNGWAIDPNQSINWVLLYLPLPVLPLIFLVCSKGLSLGTGLLLQTESVCRVPTFSDWQNSMIFPGFF